MSTLKYRSAFTKAIKRIKKANPDYPIIAWMDKMIKSGKFLDYYDAQDKIGFELGIRFGVEPYDVRETVVWKAYLLDSSANPSGEMKEIHYHREYKSEAKAYEYVAKQHLYELNNVDNIVEKFNSRSMR
ncbi:hypothetical protein [uncultured Roseivirga sp.]|uniref:hypothetical protein n=1 Tax=uncultured Roseivirga sp. TaxID=543088 RepID=UPI0030D8624C|tara:strand:- start:315295 stop:315681 length:387 start_codon:yes stop_codon:yes gene_type:complete